MGQSQTAKRLRGSGRHGSSTLNPFLTHALPALLVTLIQRLYVQASVSSDNTDRGVCGAGMSSGGEAVFRAVETPLFWLGALTAAWLSVCSVYRLLSGIRVWVLGNGRLVSPTTLGKWAGEKLYGGQ